ncbi:hypothetical protein BC938DRAFT_482295 [Jimgerdemannia flammicorona]|uniref:Uncharacterized protein n=1 Tax=Jimgerdemannia flammicorona TaxID=994334 RepID=A0A433QE74_9FUNG|nr:hypothetical protein BC938DRAFT_482295 [Jimgerdemannia flammicorona]
MNEIARLQGDTVGKQATVEAISPTVTDTKIKKTESELNDLKRRIELVTLAIEKNEKEGERLRNDRKELRDDEGKLLKSLKEQLEAHGGLNECGGKYNGCRGSC